MYTQDANGVARVHFTVSPEHYDTTTAYLEAVKSRYGAAGVRYEMTFSSQKMSIDTLAVDLENRPFHDRHGRLVFRPAGHGALLANLSDLQSLAARRVGSSSTTAGENTDDGNPRA